MKTRELHRLFGITLPLSFIVLTGFAAVDKMLSPIGLLLLSTTWTGARLACGRGRVRTRARHSCAAALRTQERG